MKKGKLHYAWIVCLGGALQIFAVTGLACNVLSVYMPFIRDINGLTNSQTSLMNTVRTLSGFILSFLTGAIYNKVSLRKGMLLAGLSSTIGYVLFGLAKTYPVYMAASMFVGIGFGVGAGIPVAVLTGNWFTGSTLAFSICSAASGLASFGIPSIITAMIQKLGLNTAFLIQGCVIFALIFTSFLIIRNVPEEMNLKPYQGKSAAAAKTTGYRVLSTKDWIITLAVATMFGISAGISYGNLGLFSRGKGFTPEFTAIVISAAGLTMTGGKLLYGFVCGKLGNKRTNFIFGLLMAAGLLMACAVSNQILMMLAMCIYGIGMGFPTVGMTAWAGDMSDPHTYAKTVRLYNTAYLLGNLLFSVIPGMIADRCNNSYVPAYLIFAAFTLISWAIVQASYKHIGKVRSEE